MTRIAFLGPMGTFSHACLLTLPVSAGAELLAQDNVTRAIDALRAGAADAAFVPIENSVEGAVAATLDELSGGEPLVIDQEGYLRVVFALQARPATTLADVKSVATHPHAEAQVRRWLIDNLPDAQVSLVGSTAGARGSGRPGRVRCRGLPGAGRRAVRADDAGRRHRRQPGRGDPVRAADASEAAAPAHRQRPHHPGRLPRVRPFRRAARTARGVRHPRGQPHPDRVAPDQGTHRPVLLLDRLRGPHQRRTGRRRDRGAAPGLPGRALPRLLPPRGRPARGSTRWTDRCRLPRFAGLARRGAPHRSSRG